MPVKPDQHLFLRDARGQEIGGIIVAHVKDDLVVGRFQPGPGFAGVQHLFAEYVEAANEQLLSLVGELDATIAAIGLQIHSPERAEVPAIYDVQIGAGVITFRHCEAGASSTPERGAATQLPTSTIHSEPRPV